MSLLLSCHICDTKYLVIWNAKAGTFKFLLVVSHINIEKLKFQESSVRPRGDLLQLNFFVVSGWRINWRKLEKKRLFVILANKGTQVQINVFIHHRLLN